MRSRVPLAVSAVLAALVTSTGTPAAAAAGPATAPAPSLAELAAQLTATTEQAQALGDSLDAASARDGGLREALDQLAVARSAAQAQLDARVRAVYISSQADPAAAWLSRIATPGLQRVLDQGRNAAVSVDRGLVDAVSGQSREVVQLQARAARFRQQLLRAAGPVLAAEDRARALLATAEELAQAQAARAEQARLAAERAALDQVSAAVTAALTPQQSARGRQAAAEQAPLLSALTAAAGGYPAGFRPTGAVLAGIASWYGPGFIGSPTSSGAPYDPEQPTCANKELPLGTVLRVSAGGRSVDCLVNDRGPYVGDRLLDLSRAGSRALGFDGLAQVTVEVLAPG